MKRIKALLFYYFYFLTNENVATVTLFDIFENSYKIDSNF